MHAKPSAIRAYVAGELDPKARRSIERHVHRCLACWDDLQTATPRTTPQWVQGANYSPAPLNAQTLLGSSVREDSLAETPRRSRFVPWIPALAVLGILVIVGSLASVAWSLGSAVAAPLVQTDPTGAWSSKATDLDADDLDDLRAAGWSCPVVEVAGFQLASATGTRHNGKAKVHIVLKNKSKELSVTEARDLSGSTLGTAMLAAPADPVAKAQGGEVSDSVLAELGKRLGAKAGATVDFRHGSATLKMDDVDYSIASNLSKKDMESLLQRLVIAEHTHLSGFDADPDKIGERLMRGLSRLMVLDFN